MAALSSRPPLELGKDVCQPVEKPTQFAVRAHLRHPVTDRTPHRAPQVAGRHQEKRVGARILSEDDAPRRLVLPPKHLQFGEQHAVGWVSLGLELPHPFPQAFRRYGERRCGGRPALNPPKRGDLEVAIRAGHLAAIAYLAEEAPVRFRECHAVLGLPLQDVRLGEAGTRPVSPLARSIKQGADAGKRCVVMLFAHATPRCGGLYSRTIGCPNPRCRVLRLPNRQLRLLILDALQTHRDRRFGRQGERTDRAEQWLGGVEVVEEEGEPILAYLPLAVDRLPVVPRLTGRFLGDFAEIEVSRVALDLKLDEVYRLIRRNGMDADYSRPVRHAKAF